MDVGKLGHVPITGQLNYWYCDTSLLPGTRAAPKLLLSVHSTGKHDQSCPRERLIILSALLWTSCFPKIKYVGVPGVSYEEVFINVR